MKDIRYQLFVKPGLHRMPESQQAQVLRRLVRVFIDETEPSNDVIAGIQQILDPDYSYTTIQRRLEELLTTELKEINDAIREEERQIQANQIKLKESKGSVSDTGLESRIEREIGRRAQQIESLNAEIDSLKERIQWVEKRTEEVQKRSIDQKELEKNIEEVSYQISQLDGEISVLKRAAVDSLNQINGFLETEDC